MSEQNIIPNARQYGETEINTKAVEARLKEFGVSVSEAALCLGKFSDRLKETDAELQKLKAKDQL